MPKAGAFGRRQVSGISLPVLVATVRGLAGVPFAAPTAGLTFRGMSCIDSPIIVAEGRDVALFVSVAEAESYLEPIDAADGIYRGYDAEGRLLKVEPDGSGVRVRAAEGSPGHVGELGDLLRGFLERVGEPVDPGCDLWGLVAACDEYGVETPANFRAVLFGSLDDLRRSVCGRELRRGRR